MGRRFSYRRSLPLMERRLRGTVAFLPPMFSHMERRFLTADFIDLLQENSLSEIIHLISDSWFLFMNLGYRRLKTAAPWLPYVCGACGEACSNVWGGKKAATPQLRRQESRRSTSRRSIQRRSIQPYIQKTCRCDRFFGWWREEDSNLRPLGYEPNELPLLHPAMSCFTSAKVRTFSLSSKFSARFLC